MFVPAKRLEAGVSALIEPHMHRGRAALVQVTVSAARERKTLNFVFQRLRYEFTEEGSVKLLECPTGLTLDEYVGADGLSKREASLRQMHYGTNVLSVPPPKFIDLYKEQLVSPLVVFQVFCAVLWALDEYWQYTVFQMVSILMLESASVFQRIKTMGTLNGMSAKPSLIKTRRGGEWVDVSTEDLLPGDLVSIRYVHPSAIGAKSEDTKKDGKQVAKADSTSAKQQEEAKKRMKARAAATLNIVPCDCLLLTGSAVANEASLTGESIPQMKDSIRGGSEVLDMQGVHRVHTLFSGTALVNTSNVGSDAPEKKRLPRTPDGGCLAFVLRTGFSSSQGQLMQMIEYSTQKVADNSRETFLAILVLLVFALAASGYVLYKGLQKGDRSTHELLLRCVIIIASVVPRQLPMQMAVAVNTALLALMKKGVFCTEPYRMPFAGKITHCLFDKTGTLTTDQLLPVGVVNAGNSRDKDSKSADGTRAREVTKVANADSLASMVLAGCHSLVNVEGAGLVGDPIELAAMQGLNWSYDARTATATPGDATPFDKRVAEVETALKDIGAEPKAQGAARKAYSDRKSAYEKLLADAKTARAGAAKRAKQHNVRSIRILNRFHFASKLQRMSVLARVTTQGRAPSKVCLVKGSPEALLPLMAKDQVPAWFTATHTRLAEKGMRVLALAYKWVDAKDVGSTGDRTWVESGLSFCGFIAFACKTRSDSRLIVQSLTQSDHRVAMITGDAALTALHVAGEVGIGSQGKGPALVLKIASPASGGADGKEAPSDESTESQVEWAQALSCAPGETPLTLEFQAEKIRNLSREHTLLVTERALLAADRASGGSVWAHVDCIHVFARMSPRGKARVISSMQQLQGHHVLMCGDGGNDVGALKQADVGLALLSGYGNTNAGTSAVDAEADAESKNAEERLNEREKQLGLRKAASVRIQKQLFAKKQTEIRGKMKEWMEEEMEARRQRGEDTGFMANFAVMKVVMARSQAAMAAEKRKLAAKYGNVYDDKGAAPDQTADAGLVPMVRPGDASVAAPFTSRAPSVANVVTLIRQGRCTLLSALQQQQIMMLECIITAFTLSALSLEGARSSQRQMMASSWLIMIASLSFSYSGPVDVLDKVKPIGSLFHPAVFISMLGQATIHLYCMWHAVALATARMGPEKLKEVVNFHRRDDEAEAALLESIESGAEEEDWDFWSMWEKPFLPNLMNTVIFLVETSQIVAILFVNYKGRPWMKGLLENHSLFLSIFLCVALVATCAWGVFPEINAMVHLAPFPDDSFRWQVMALVAASLVGTFIWDRIVVAIFAKDIFGAMMDSARRTTLKDLMPVFSTAAKVVGGVLLLGSGNLLMWGIAFYAYRRFFRKTEQPEKPILI